MKYFAFAIFVCLSTLAMAVTRTKRQAYALPDGAELIVGNIQQTFTCPQNTYTGYYADVANDCKVFHVCHPVTHADGQQETLQWSFFCGNQTIFNQLTLTCGFPEESIPCQQAPDFYYVNQNIGQEDALFLTDDDVTRGNQVVEAAYGTRTARRQQAGK